MLSEAEAVVSVKAPVLRASNVRGLSRLARQLSLRDICLDLAAVDYPTAGGLGQLLALRGQLRAAGGRLALANVGDGVREVLQVTGLAEAFDPPCGCA